MICLSTGSNNYFVFGALAAGFTVLTAGFMGFTILTAGFTAFVAGFAGLIAFLATFALILQTGFTVLAVAAGFTHFVATTALAGTAFFGAATFLGAAKAGSRDTLNNAIAQTQTITFFIFYTSSMQFEWPSSVFDVVSCLPFREFPRCLLLAVKRFWTTLRPFIPTFVFTIIMLDFVTIGNARS
jgi:hypothetical protein